MTPTYPDYSGVDMSWAMPHVGRVDEIGLFVPPAKLAESDGAILRFSIPGAAVGLQGTAEVWMAIEQDVSSPEDDVLYVSASLMHTAPDGRTESAAVLCGQYIATGHCDVDEAMDEHSQLLADVHHELVTDVLPAMGVASFDALLTSDSYGEYVDGPGILIADVYSNPAHTHATLERDLLSLLGKMLREPEEYRINGQFDFSDPNCKPSEYTGSISTNPLAMIVLVHYGQETAKRYRALAGDLVVDDRVPVHVIAFNLPGGETSH